MSDTNMANMTIRGAIPSVLVIDDDAFTQDLLSEMLGQLGVKEMHAATSAQAALKMLISLPKPPDVLICDVFMPDMDGVELLNQLAERRYAGDIVMVTGVDPTMMGLSGFIGASNGLNMVGSLVKPISLQQLGEVLRLTALA